MPSPRPQSLESSPGGQETKYEVAVGPAEITEPSMVCWSTRGSRTETVGFCAAARPAARRRAQVFFIVMGGYG